MASANCHSWNIQFDAFVNRLSGRGTVQQIEQLFDVFQLGRPTSGSSADRAGERFSTRIARPDPQLQGSVLRARVRRGVGRGLGGSFETFETVRFYVVRSLQTLLCAKQGDEH